MVSVGKRSKNDLHPFHEFPNIVSRQEWRNNVVGYAGTPAERALYAQTFPEQAAEMYAFSPATPRNVHISVPLTNFATDFARDRNRFLIETICPSLTVDKLQGKFWRFDSPEAFRIEDASEDNYAPGRGGGRPKRLELEINTDTYECLQYALSEEVPQVGEQNADFNLKRRIVQMLTTSMMTRRAKRTLDLITTTGNMNNVDVNAITGTNGNWTNGTNTDPNIQISFNHAVRTIQENTFNSVDEANIWCLINPEMAGAMAESAEVRDTVKQSLAGERMLLGQAPYSNAGRYGLPTQLYGVKIMVVPIRYISSIKKVPDSNTAAYILDKDSAVFLNVEPPGLETLSTLTCFEFQPFITEDHPLPSEHISSVQTLHTYHVKITAKSSGYLITDIFSSPAT